MVWWSLMRDSHMLRVSQVCEATLGIVKIVLLLLKIIWRSVKRMTTCLSKTGSDVQSGFASDPLPANILKTTALVHQYCLRMILV